MKHEKLDIEQALQLGAGLPFSLIRSLSRVTLGRTPSQIGTDELIEACFFSETEEVRLFRQDGALKAVRLIEESGDRLLRETYALENPRFGEEIQVARLLEADEDGQMYVTATRLTGWKEVSNHG